MLRVSARTVQSAYLPNRVRCQQTPGTSLRVFGVVVALVISGGTGKQVIRIHTTRVVTPMTDKVTVRDCPGRPFMREPVGIEQRIPTVAGVDDSVPERRPGSRPHPTTVRAVLVHLGPEAFFQRPYLSWHDLLRSEGLPGPRFGGEPYLSLTSLRENPSKEHPITQPSIREPRHLSCGRRYPPRPRRASAHHRAAPSPRRKPDP